MKAYTQWFNVIVNIGEWNPQYGLGSGGPHKGSFSILDALKCNLGHTGLITHNIMESYTESLSILRVTCENVAVGKYLGDCIGHPLLFDGKYTPSSGIWAQVPSYC